MYVMSFSLHVYVTSDSPQVALLLSFASKSITHFALRNHGDDSQHAKMCKLQEVWASNKGPLCEFLHALFCGKLKAERWRFIWDFKLKRQSTERGELKRRCYSKKREEREEGYGEEGCW